VLASFNDAAASSGDAINWLFKIGDAIGTNSSEK